MVGFRNDMCDESREAINPKLRIKYRFIHFHVRVGSHSEAAATFEREVYRTQLAAVMSCSENSRGLDVDQFDMNLYLQ